MKETMRKGYKPPPKVSRRPRKPTPAPPPIIKMLPKRRYEINIIIESRKKAEPRIVE
ncbi:MAG: hypothetical protein KAR20_02575 [Candidatus Heimdallarchaeota archaeon]|nr:hypothetical protein [Candidatus Heimdallarchaeota archaeon]